MLDAKLAAEKLKVYGPNLEISSCKDYDDSWLFTAFKTKTDLDPFYLVNKTTGEVSPYTIASDARRYYSTPDVSYE